MSCGCVVSSLPLQVTVISTDAVCRALFPAVPFYLFCFTGLLVQMPDSDLLGIFTIAIGREDAGYRMTSAHVNGS